MNSKMTAILIFAAVTFVNVIWIRVDLAEIRRDESFLVEPKAEQDDKRKGCADLYQPGISMKGNSPWVECILNGGKQ